MGTRSTIGVENDDGTVTYVYCHWDGYLSHNGRILLENYPGEYSTRQLISHGDISGLGESCEKPEGHSYDSPVKGYTVYYGRDRGTSDVEPKTASAIEHGREHQEYNYLFTKKGWTYCTDRALGYVPLTEETINKTAKG